MIEDGIKISELTATSTISNEDLIPIVQNNETKSISFGNINKYSTTETIIGTWENYDGTIVPHYRKEIYATTPPTGDTSITIISNLPNNIDNVTKLDGMIISQSARFPINSYFSNTYYISTFYDPSVGINCRVGSNLTSRPCVVVIEYTKTTN